MTSIAEAKHSTSTNNSMKRLTWITVCRLIRAKRRMFADREPPQFIFLPLTFISVCSHPPTIMTAAPTWPHRTPTPSPIPRHTLHAQPPFTTQAPTASLNHTQSPHLPFTTHLRSTPNTSPSHYTTDKPKSLFGMNVDVLDPPPPWWWYLPIAAGTMILTVTVWIIFKRNETVGFPLSQLLASSRAISLNVWFHWMCAA